MDKIINPIYVRNKNIVQKRNGNLAFGQVILPTNLPKQHEHNNFAYPNVVSNMVAVNKANINKNISFGSSGLSPLFDDFSDFNSDPAEFFSINQFHKIHSFLMKYKTEKLDENVVFLKNYENVNKITSTRSITLRNNAKAENISAEIVDLYDDTEAQKIDAKKLGYLGDRSKAAKVSAERIFLGDNSKVQEINAKNIVWLKDYSKSGQVSAENVYLRNHANAQEVNANDSVYIRDNAEAQKINAKETVILRDNAKAGQVFSESGNIELDDNSQINLLTSEKNIDLKGSGQVDNIETKGDMVILTGSLKLKNKIKFENNGTVIVKKDENRKSAIIKSSMVENGKLLFDCGNGLLANPQDIFKAGIESVLFEKIEPEYKKHLGEYANIDSLRKHYSGSNPVLANKLNELCSNGNSKKVEILYDKFINDTLQTIANPEPKKFTTLWTINKKLGDQNLANFWLKSLDKNTSNKKPAEKTSMINNLSDDERKQLIEVTTNHFIEKVLPKELNKQNNTDLNDLKESLEYTEDVAKQIQQGQKEAIAGLLKNDGYEKLKTTVIGHKNIIDLWIDSVEGEGASQKYTQRLKQNRILSLINDPNNTDKIVNTTLEQACNHKESIKTAKNAYSNIIENEAELEESHKKLLKEYENSKLFFYVVTNKANPSDLAEIEVNTINTTKDIVRQKKEIEGKTRKNIFEPVRDLRNIYKNQDNPEMQEKIDFVFNMLQDKINSSSKPEANKTKIKIAQLQRKTEENSDNIANIWADLVDDAQKHFEHHVLSEVTTKNIELLNSMNNRLKEEKDKTILNAISDKSLNTIEQKEFISRYKDDNNLKTILKNSGINKKESIDSLLYLEAINKQVFKSESEFFRGNITDETVKTKENLVNKYISALGKDYSPMSIEQKTEFLCSIAPEELKLTAHIVYKNWEKDELSKFMSEKFVEVDHENNINAQGKNIVNELKKVNTSLDKINININGQNHTLLEISTNFNKFSDMYLISQEAQHNELCNMAKQLASINKNTMNIEANTKALVANALKDIDDPRLRDEMKALLPEDTRVDLSKFLEIVNKKAQEEKNEKRKKRLLLIAGLVAAVVTAGAIAYIAAPTILASGSAASLGTTSIATTAHAVNSATMAHASGSTSLMSALAFGFTKTISDLIELMRKDSNPAVRALSSKVTSSTTEKEIWDWIYAAGGLWG